jgi:hypothetical protein
MPTLMRKNTLGIDAKLIAQIDGLSDEINNEVGELAFGLEPGYDWNLMKLVT